MTINHQDHVSADIALPQLDDEAVVQIHDFIYYCLERFEARYGDQIHRYYQDRSRDNLWEPQDQPDWGDLPL
jgi:hypothetical protein